MIYKKQQPIKYIVPWTMEYRDYYNGRMYVFVKATTKIL